MTQIDSSDHKYMADLWLRRTMQEVEAATLLQSFVL